MALTVRLADQDDAAAIDAVESAAFGQEGPQIVELIHALREHPCGRDRLSLVAQAGERVVGHTMVTRGRLDTFGGIVDVGILSPLAVDPDVQRTGVGRTLVDHAVRSAVDVGFPVIFLEGDPAYYSRLGWQAAKPLGFRKPSIRIPDAAFQCRLLPDYDASMAGTLVYPEPFWDLDCVGLRDPAFIAWLTAEVAEGREL